jgi:hypothetical protein
MRVIFYGCQRSAVCFVGVGGACGAMAWFLPIAAPVEMSLFVFQVIAPLPQVFWVLQISLFIHRVVEDEQKP